jgi:hypothetical protein
MRAGHSRQHLLDADVHRFAQPGRGGRCHRDQHGPLR